MPGWVLPLALEVVLTLVFAGVILSLRRSLSKPGVALWVFLWAGRGAGTLFSVRYLSASDNSLFALYTPLQVAFGLALIVIVVRLETQKDELRSLNDELSRLRKEALDYLDRDQLTGMLNRSALDRWVERGQGFQGLVVVCDMDDFKILNDRFGHLVGDEILHGVGKLVRGSIRDNDLAFRWGGDEFVIFFANPDREVVESRMRQIHDRLRTFHIRKHGPVAVRFSYGIATVGEGSLRDALAEADRLMLETKRAARLLRGEPASSRG